MMRFPHGAPDFHAKSNGEEKGGGGRGEDSAHRGRGVSESGDRKLWCVDRKAGENGGGGGGGACMGKLCGGSEGVIAGSEVKLRALGSKSRMGIERDGRGRGVGRGRVD